VNGDFSPSPSLTIKSTTLSFTPIALYHDARPQFPLSSGNKRGIHRTILYSRDSFAATDSQNSSITKSRCGAIQYFRAAVGMIVVFKRQRASAWNAIREFTLRSPPAPRVACSVPSFESVRSGISGWEICNLRQKVPAAVLRQQLGCGPARKVARSQSRQHIAGIGSDELDTKSE